LPYGAFVDSPTKCKVCSWHQSFGKNLDTQSRGKAVRGLLLPLIAPGAVTDEEAPVTGFMVEGPFCIRLEARRTQGKATMIGNPDADTFERLVATARWRAWTLAAIFSGVMSGIVILGKFVSPPGPQDLRPYLESIGAVLVVTIGLPTVMFYAEKRTVRHLRPLEPYVAEASHPWARMTLLLRDGMVVTVAATSNVVTCAMVFATDGTVFQPSLEQGIRWMRLWHIERLGVVSNRSGPPEAWAELNALRKAFRAHTCVCIAGRIRPSAPGQTAPLWIVSATFVSMFPLPLRVDQLASKLAAMERLLTRALGGFGFAQGVPPIRLERAGSLTVADEERRGSLPLPWAVRGLFVRLRRERPAAFAVFLVSTAVAAVLVALQGVLSPTFAFLALVAGGFAIGRASLPLRDAVVTGFIMGYIAYLAGTVAFALSSSILAGYTAERVAAEAGIGVFVGAVVGVVGGVWTAGGAALGSVLRWRLHAGNIL